LKSLGGGLTVCISAKTAVQNKKKAQKPIKTPRFAREMIKNPKKGSFDKGIRRQKVKK
jgi:hypothetical protein